MAAVIPAEVTEKQVRKLSPAAIDTLCDRRVELQSELETVNDQLKDQVTAHGFTPTGAEKSKRVLGTKFQVTLSSGSSTEIRDAQVAVIEKSCPSDVFAQLFEKVTKFKLKSGASMLLAGTLPPGAPSNLRKLFSAAVVMKDRAPSLNVKLLGEE